MPHIITPSTIEVSFEIAKAQNKVAHDICVLLS